MAASPKLEIIIGAKADQLKAALADLTRALDALSTEAAQAGTDTAGAFKNTESQLGKTRAGVQSISDQLAKAKAQLIGFFSVQYGVGLAKDIIATADAFATMNARLALATKSSEEYQTAQKALFDISQRTASSMESTVGLYGRVADSMREMGRSQADALAFTEAVGQSMRISGASAATSAAGITQLSQALASGVLRGDEFNSVMENSPRLARAMADGLGVPIGQLRKLAEAGKLTADAVTEALLSQADTLSEEYSKIPLTVGAAMTQVSNAWTKFIGEADQAAGATKTIAAGVSHLADNFRQYADVVVALGRDALVVLAGIAAVRLASAAREFALLALEAKAAGTAIKSIPTSVKIAIAVVGFELLKKAGEWLGEFVGELVHGKIPAEDFGKALGDAGRGARELKRDTDELVAAIEKSNRISAFGQVGESAEDAKKRLRAAADAIVAAFDDVVEKSGDVGKALEAAFSRADLKSGSGIDAYMMALDDLAAKGKATGEQIRKSLEDGLGKLDLTALTQAQFAIQASNIEAAKLAEMLGFTLDAALKKLGTDAQAVNDGLSKGFRDVAQAFGLIVDNAQASAEAIRFAFDKLIDTARTKAEVEALKREFQALAESGKLSAGEVGDAWLRLEDKLRMTAGPLDGALADSFARMGAKSAEAMRGAAEQMAVDFERIKASGVASAEGIDAAYQKMKASVVASVNAMTTATREALQASKDYTASMQAGLDAVKARGTAIEAAAKAQAADAEYARASAEAMKSGTAAAHAKAEALRLAAEAAHAMAEAAEADAVAALKSAEAAKAEEAAKRAIAEAARLGTEASRNAAAAAQNYANETARGAEESRQAAIAAHEIAARVSAAANEASALASAFGSVADSAVAAANSITNMESVAVAALDERSYEALVKQAYDSAKAAISSTKTEIDRLIERAGDGMGWIVAFGERGVAAYLDAAKRAREYGEELARIEAATERNEAATRSWESALNSLARASASLKDELDRALGNEEAIENRAYDSKKRDLEAQYQAALEAARALDGRARGEAEAAARKEYQDALSSLDRLHRIKLDNIAKEAAEKSAADAKNHNDEMARIAAEEAARRKAADLLDKVGSSSYSGGASSAAASSNTWSTVNAPATYNQTLNINTAGGLSEDTIRREIAPVLNRMMAGAR